MANDSLAQGARSATYGNSGVKVSAEKWKSIFGDPEIGLDAKKPKKALKKFQAKA